MANRSSANNALPEILRQQYLAAMEIQSWFDPDLDIELLLSDKKQPLNSSSVIEQSSSEAVAEPLKKEAVVDVAPKQTPQIDSAITDEANNFVVSVDAPPLVQNQDDFQNNPEPTNLNALNIAINTCQLCELHTMREQPVYGEGNENADCLILIDAPVMDHQSEYALFDAVNKTMLKAMLHAIGLPLSSVFLSSLVKCRPAEQRAPHTSEMVCCDDYLDIQIKLIKPKVILVLGESACQQLLVSQKTLPDLRLRHHQYLGVPVVASYHPFELLNSSETKRKVWADMLQIRKHLNLG